jgi:hypothetical protein
VLKTGTPAISWMSKTTWTPKIAETPEEEKMPSTEGFQQQKDSNNSKNTSNNRNANSSMIPNTAGKSATAGLLQGLPVLLTTAENLPPVSATPMENNGNNIRMLTPLIEPRILYSDNQKRVIFLKLTLGICLKFYSLF